MSLEKIMNKETEKGLLLTPPTPHPQNPKEKTLWNKPTSLWLCGYVM